MTGEEASLGSSCSITSGTPSTDIRFSEYNLERVSTLIIQDDEVLNERPTRAYSVGSRPVNINNTSTRYFFINSLKVNDKRVLSSRISLALTHRKILEL